MLTPFHLDKTIQATAALLKTSKATRMSRLRTLKLLYIAERESLKETGRTITGDRVVAMDHGPVLSTVYNLIKGQHADAATWDEFMRRDGEHDIQLLRDPGNGKLSRYEIEKISNVAERFEHYNDWALVEYTHSFPEWIKNKPESGSRRKIPLEDILTAIEMLDEKETLRQDAAGLTSVQRLFSSRSTLGGASD
jgi:uncharacterized phage-associated protein